MIKTKLMQLESYPNFNTILSSIHVKIFQNLLNVGISLVKPKKAAPPLSPTGLDHNLRVVAVGDIHGMLKELRELDEKIAIDLKTVRLQSENIRTTYIFLGDYVDRGPDSAGVIDYLLNLRSSLADKDEIIFLRGNHEQLFIDFLEDENEDVMLWLRSGGFEALESYGVFLNRKHSKLQRSAARHELQRKMPAAHLQFLQETRFSHSIGDYFFCHATVDPNIAFDKQVAKDLLWSRDTKFLDEHYIGKFIVHGHTPVKLPIMAKGHANIDTGAYATGELTALILFETDRYFVSNKS